MENRFKLTGGQVLLDDDVMAAIVKNDEEQRAEIERLTQADRQWADHVKRLADERDEAEARADQWCAAANRQVAEIRQLRESLDMVAEERDSWRARALGQPQEPCRHDG